MEKNYYDILQVNKNASPEIIEKAYKVLAKKYHPDLQEEKNKKQAEEILKEINEAYEILSNPEKKKNYDNLLQEKEYLENEQKFQQQNGSNNSTNYKNVYTANISKQELLRKQEIIKKQKRYNNAYIHNFESYIKGFVSIILTLCILFLILQLPFVKQYFKNLYIENGLFKVFIDFIASIFKI